MPERVLLAGGTEHVPEAVDDELHPEQQRDGGQHEGRSPEVAPQSAVEEARSHEASGQARIVEPFQADQPGSVLGTALLMWVGAGPQRAGAHQHGPRPGPRLATQIDRVVHDDAGLLERGDQPGVAFGGEHRDHL